MIERKQITFLIKVMNGGGAERVVSLLSNAMIQRGYEVSLILTHQKKSEADLRELDDKIEVISLDDKLSLNKKKVIKSDIIMLYARVVEKIVKSILKKESDISAIYKYWSRNYEKISWLQSWFIKRPDSVAIAFMYDSIFMTLLSTTPKNRVIISERGDPNQYIKSRTVEAFIRAMFKKADSMVFQSPDVRDWYLKNYQLNGTIIYNSVKSDLPRRYIGERKKYIVNFCRISPEKNLHLLIDAYVLFQQEYPEYELFIYGNSNDWNSAAYEKRIREKIDLTKCKEKIHLLEARKDIHSIINDYAMFVSSSNHEGMSNSMLEAMAIGLPVICTDCPAGGARAIITHEENGLLVPVKDTQKMYLAMKQLVENPKLAERISSNASNLRDMLSVEKIIMQWERILIG